MADTMAFDSRTERGTFRLGRVRWTICAVQLVATSNNYIERQVIAIFKPTLDHSIGMTAVSYGYIVDAFQIAYAIGLPAAGGMIDNLGTRIGYLLVIAAWSLPTMGKVGTGVGSLPESVSSALFALLPGHILQLMDSYASLFGIAASAYLLALVLLSLLAPGLKKVESTA
jgi:MFS family permease